MKNVTYLLENFDENELSVLHKLLDTKENSIEYKLGKLLLPAGGLLQSPLNYTQFLRKIASHNNIVINFENGNIEAEQELFKALYKKEFDKMSESEKDEYLKKMEKEGLNNSQIAALTGVATLGIAQASGFGVYLLASSTIGAISSAVGVTLPFALYTTVSSAISLFIGPLGFLVMGIAVYKSFKEVKNIEEVFDKFKFIYKGIKKTIVGDYEVATICFNYIAAMRTIIPVRFENEICQKQKELSDNEAEIEKITLCIDNNNQQINSSKESIHTLKNQIQDLEIQIENKENKVIETQLTVSIIEQDNLELEKKEEIIENTNQKINFSLAEKQDKLKNFISKTENKEN